MADENLTLTPEQMAARIAELEGRLVELTQFRRRCWGERKQEVTQCREHIHHMLRNTGAGLSS